MRLKSRVQSGRGLSMFLYFLASTIGVLFMLAGVAVVGAYLYFSVYKRMPAAAPSLELAFTLYLVGHALFLFRNYLITDIAHQIKMRGDSGMARILSAKELGSPDEAPDRYWYELHVEVNADDGKPEKFTTSITQLFAEQARTNLHEGATLPVKYSRKHDQAIVVGDNAFVSIRK